jgi:hypothetical protein
LYFEKYATYDSYEENAIDSLASTLLPFLPVTDLECNNMPKVLETIPCNVQFDKLEETGGNKKEKGDG